MRLPCRVVLILLAVHFGLPCAASRADTLAGEARVIDGDCIEIDGRDVRLLDVDTPELAQRCQGSREVRRCGEAAAQALARRVAGAEVICSGEQHDDFGRLLARCQVKGDELSAWLVREGWGLAFVRYSDRLAGLERQARSARRGIWKADRVEPPWDFRARGW